MPMLVPETAGRLDQHDRHIQALAETRNWKQVLAQIDKRLKKAKNHRLSLNKALVQLRMPDRQMQLAGCKLLRSTLASLAPVLHNDILEAVEDVANTQVHLKDLRGIASTMWETTLKASPNNEELLLTVFEQKVAVGDWDAARKFSMTKMKTDHDWFLRWVVCVHLISISKRSKAPAMMKSMNAGLATKSLAKAVSDAISSMKLESTQPKGARYGPMRSSKDLDLLIEVHLRHEMYEELAKLLDDIDESGLGSYTGGISAYARERIKAVILSKNWTALLRLAKKLLQDARSSENNSVLTSTDNWAVWDAYITGLSESQEDDSDQLSQAAQIMKSYMKEHKSLNAHLAYIALILRIPDAATELEADVLDLYGSYLKDHGHKLFAFNQLKQSRYLQVEHKKPFLNLYRSQAEERRGSEVNTLLLARDWLNTEINSLKQDYYHVVSASTTTPSSQKLLSAFAANCLRLYKVALAIEASRDGLDKVDNKEVEGPTERFMGDDAAILAAMALIHLWFLSDDNSLLRSAFILEAVLSQSKHNYDAILLAVRVYLYMGQFARAAYLYKQLDTKNIQNLSVAWILIPRLSSMHPHKSKLWRDGPEALLQRGSRWLKASRGALRRASVDTIRQGAYTNFLRTIETFELHHQSVAALTFATEIDRTSWSRGTTTAGSFSGLELNSLDAVRDPRELTSFPCYEHFGKSSLEVALRAGPLPHTTWVQAQLRTRHLRYLALGGSVTGDDASDEYLLFCDKSATDTPSDQGASDMTSLETKEDEVVMLLFNWLLALLLIAEKKRSATEETKASLSQFLQACDSRAAWISSEAKHQFSRVGVGSDSWHTSFRWDMFHWIHQQMYLNDLLMGMLRLMVLCTRMWSLDIAGNASTIPTSLKTFEKAADEFRMIVKRWTTHLQAELRQPETIQQLVAATSRNQDREELIVELETRMGDHREFAIDMANGWADSLEAFTAKR